jgi:hypothetical protein
MPDRDLHVCPGSTVVVPDSTGPERRLHRKTPSATGTAEARRETRFLPRVVAERTCDMRFISMPSLGLFREPGAVQGDWCLAPIDRQRPRGRLQGRDLARV